MVAVEEEDAATLKLMSEPVPLSGTASGLVKELSVMVSVPFRWPVAVGEKLTWAAQLPPGAIGFVQLLVWLKSPVTLILLTFKGRFPMLVMVTAIAELVVP